MKVKNATINIPKSDTVYVPFEKTVNVHKAPTDESIKLFHEFREKAVKDIIEKVNVTDNIVNGYAMYISTGTSPDIQFTLHYKFMLNGEKISGKVDVKYEYGRDSKALYRNLLKRLYDEMSKAIAYKIVEDFHDQKIYGKINMGHKPSNLKK